jgi:hypothetical protein
MRHKSALFLVLIAVLLCTWCGWVSGFHRATTPARVTWAISLASVVVVDVLLWQGRRGRRWGWRLDPARDPWPRPSRGGARRALAGVWLWLGLSFVVLVWDLLGLNTGKHEAHLTISALTQAYRSMNAGMLLVWMLVGIGYGAARARAPVIPTPPEDQVDTRPSGHASLGCPAWPLIAPAVLLPSSRIAGVIFWLGVVAVAVLVDQIGRRSGGRMANAEELLRLITRPVAANVILVVAWAYAGYHLFAH